MPFAFYILFGAALTAVTSLALGRLILRRSGLNLCRLEEDALGYVAGSACLSGLIFLLAWAGLVYKGTVLALAVLVIGYAARTGALRPATQRLAPLDRRLSWLYGAVAAAFMVLYFFNAMAPEFSPDGSSYHLGSVARYYRAHGFVRTGTDMYANLSQGVELLFLFAWAFGRHSAAALVHFSFLIATPLLMFAWARRRGLGHAGAAAGLFFFVSPVAGIDGISAYNDVAVAAILFAVFYALDAWSEDRNPRWWPVIGMLAGFAYATKYTAFLALPFAVVWLILCLRRTPRQAVRACATVILAASIWIMPWMVRNALSVGNPVSPFFNRIFPNPYVHVSFEERYRADMSSYPGLNSHWAIPAEVTVKGHALGGVIGPLFLLSPLALLALRSPAGRRLLAALVVFGVTYFANVGSRFLIPVLPFLALALAIAVAPARGALVVLVIAHAFASWPSVLDGYCDRYAWRLNQIPFRAALRLEREEDFLNGMSPLYAMARLVDQVVPPASQVYSASQLPEAYSTRDIVVGQQSAEGEILLDLLWTPLIREYQPVGRLEFHFPEKSLRRVRAVQTATGRPDLWSISEFRVKLKGRELPRDPSWRLRAYPNPWDVQMAFDNSAVTRWRSWETLRDGMYVEIDFGRDVSLDQVSLEISRDQLKANVRLECVDAHGAIIPAGEPEGFELTELPSLRRAATQEMKTRGVEWLVMSDSDFGADDIHRNPAAWGLSLAGERGATRLYRID